jgi:ubiquinone/menaquinone biosynthesis C-methylase UbiE
MAEIDRERADAFAARMVEVLNHGALALMISIGHRTGLFDALATVGPASSERLAAAAGLNERYVREWLGALVTGRVVEFDATHHTYALPSEHAAALTRAASPGNVATTMQWLPVLAGVEDRIVECFRNGGGVPYSAYPRFHAVMAEESDQTTLSALIDAILPVVPGLVERMRHGIDVLDLGCGSGRAINLMARTFPDSRFTGADMSPEGIAAAQAEATRLGLANARFEVVDAAKLDTPERYDLVTTFDAVHDQADPRAVLHNLRRALRAGGTYLMQEIGASSYLHENVAHPMGPFLYTISCLHCMTVSLSAGGAGLGAVWGEQQATAMLHEAGFEDVTVHRLPHDPLNYYFVARP